jgi:hypothetical protein
MKLTDSEIISSFTTCTRAVCCANCKLNGKPKCIAQLNEMVIDLLERQNAVVKKVERANKVKKQMARNEGKRLLSKKG